jgi:hypothetical protein
MNSEAVAAWIEGNGGTPTPMIRARQFHYQCGLMMIAMEDYFGQHEEGLMSAEQFYQALYWRQVDRWHNGRGR